MRYAAPLVVAGLVGLGACSDLNPVDAGRGALGPGGVMLNAQAADEEIVPGQIIVRFRPGAARSEIAEQHRARKKADMLLERTEIMEVPVGQEAEIAAQLSKNPNVEFAETDRIAKLGPCEVSTACNLPDGQFFHYKWDLHNTGAVLAQATGKADADIDWSETFDYLGGNNFAGEAVIGVLDTGIRPTHQAFAGKIRGGRRFLNDGVAATNYIDDHSHGTHVAGIAAGIGTSAVPGVGYGRNIKLLVGKVCNSAGSCPSSATADGIVWMADNGANVINMSLGSFGGNPDGTGSAAQLAALRYAVSKNVLPVCATGNDDAKPANGYAGGVGYPARFDECMAVGATSWSDTKASYSNYGAHIDISAPGGDGNALGTGNSLILAAVQTGDGSYNWKAGTSMATPQVAGLAALLYATGTRDAAAIRQRLMATADDVESAGWDNRTGAGRINAYRAITGQNPNAAPVAQPGSGYAGGKGVAMQFDGSASNDPNGKPVTLAWDFGDPASGAANTSTLVSPTHTYLRAGNYTVTLTVTDAAGLKATSTTTAAIANIVPSISAVAGARLMLGEGFTATGSFADADPDSWTATVDYGDGAGAQPLALNGRSFSLSHSYTTAGSHTVRVTVRDDDGGADAITAEVIVWTPQQGIQATLIDAIDESSIPETNVTSLVAPLRAAQAALENGNSNAATGQMQAFVNHVSGLVRGGQISAGTGAELTGKARRVMSSINR